MYCRVSKSSARTLSAQVPILRIHKWSTVLSAQTPTYLEKKPSSSNNVKKSNSNFQNFAYSRVCERCVRTCMPQFTCEGQMKCLVVSFRAWTQEVTLGWNPICLLSHSNSPCDALIVNVTHRFTYMHTYTEVDLFERLNVLVRVSIWNTMAMGTHIKEGI